MLIAFFALAFCITNSYRDENSQVLYRYNIKMEGGRTPQITKDTTITQKFISPSNNLNIISFRILMPSISTNSNVNVKVLDEEQEIYNGDIFLGQYNDGDFVNVSIDKQKNSKNKTYSLIITGLDGDEFNSVQIPYSTDENNNLRGSSVNGENQINNIMLRVTYNYDEVLNKLQFVLWIILFVGCCIFVCFGMDEEVTEKTFLKLALLLGVFFILYTPIFHNFDEWDHYFKVLLLSQGDFYYEKNDEGTIGGTIPDNIENYLEVYKGDRGISLKNYLLDSSVFNEKFSTDYSFVKNHYFATRIPLVYMIPAIGTIIGRYIFNNIYLSIILGRLMIYIAYIVLCYFAIKNARDYKTIFFVVATSPIAFWISGTIGVDPILNGASLLFISICLKYILYEEKNVTKKDAIVMIITGVALVVSKLMVGMPVLLLFFFIPRKKFESTLKYILFILLAFLIVIVMMIWQLNLISVFHVDEDRNGNVSAFDQLLFIKTSPIAFIRLFTDEMQDKMCAWNKCFSYDGIVSGINGSTGLILLMAAMLEKNKSKKMQEKVFINVVCVGIFLVVLFGSLFVMYLTYTSVGKSVLEGFQMRYLVFPMILFLIPISNILRVENKIRNYDAILILITLIMNVDLILGELSKTFGTYHINY